MSKLKLGFIGAGNMATAIVGGVLKKGICAPEDILMADPMADQLNHMKTMGVSLTADNATVASWADLLILAIKPQVYNTVLPGLSGAVSGKCVVSIAPGITTGYLKLQLPGAKIVRVMPNTPLLIGMGATAIAQPEHVSEEMFDMVKHIFSSAGEIAVLPEAQMDAIIAVSGSSPAFFFRMINAMVEEAQRQGIDSELAMRMGARTMEGAANMLLKSGKTAKELTVQVCSPGGTTLAALSAFDELDFDGLIAKAMKRCTLRSKQLGK